MSGNINVTNPESKKRVLMVVANPTTSPQTGWPVGFWWSELTHPYLAFTEAGYDVDIRSPDGGTLEADGFSDPEDDSGYSAADFVSLGFKKSPQHAGLLHETASIEGISCDDYDAVFLVGGQSPMVTFVENRPLHDLVVDFYESGKITSLVCHATCVLLRARLSNGDLLVTGKTWTGFADAEEAYADEFVGQRIQPFWIETEARKLENTNFVIDQMFRPFAVRDGNLITGQQQFSGAETARLVIDALGR
jgi:putative intracellular protease/amidase